MINIHANLTFSHMPMDVKEVLQVACISLETLGGTLNHIWGNISCVFLIERCIIVGLQSISHVSHSFSFLLSPSSAERCRSTEQTDTQIGGITRPRGFTFHQGTVHQILFVCSVLPEAGPLFFVSKTERRATKHQNRKMQKWGREKERRRKRGREERAFTAVVRQCFLW